MQHYVSVRARGGEERGGEDEVEVERRGTGEVEREGGGRGGKGEVKMGEEGIRRT